MGSSKSANGRKREQRQGAREARTSLAARLHSWLRHHRSSASDARRKMLVAPVQAAMTTLVIAIALALPAALYVAVGNLQQISSGIESSAQITIYLNHSTNLNSAKRLQQQLRDQQHVTHVEVVSAEVALSEFQNQSGLGEVLALLDDNPLPHALVVELDQTQVSPQTLADTADRFRSLPGVDTVRLDMKWVQRLHAILEMGRRLALALGIALALGVLLVIGNTIRLAVENRRDEIVVVKLVGGTNGYVRRPFLYTGLWYGLTGGLLGWLLVWGGMMWLDGAMIQLSSLYQSGFRLSGLGLSELATLLVGGGGLGLFGAWLAVGRHLSEIEPG